MSVYRLGAGYVGGVHRILSGNVHHRYVSLLHSAVVSGVVQNSGIESRANNGSIGSTFAAAPLILVLHQGLNLALGHAGMNRFERGKMSGHRSSCGLDDQVDLTLVLAGTKLPDELP